MLHEIEDLELERSRISERAEFSVAPPILAIDITREGFDWALSHACLSHFDRQHFGAAEEWRAELESSPVRIQWDPDRDLRLNPLPYRAIQVGLSGEAVTRYLDDWIVGITDVTQLAADVHKAVRHGNTEAATALLPPEREFPLPGHIGKRIGSR